MVNFLLKISFSLLLTMSLFSCVSTTQIRAVNPETNNTDDNVKIYIDGQYKGSGLVSYSDTKIVGSTTSISLRKEGCRSEDQMMVRSERVNVGALVGGIFVWPILLWVMDYNPSRDYEFQCRSRK